MFAEDVYITFGFLIICELSFLQTHQCFCQMNAKSEFMEAKNFREATKKQPEFRAISNERHLQYCVLFDYSETLFNWLQKEINLI